MNEVGMQFSVNEMYLYVRWTSKDLYTCTKDWLSEMMFTHIYQGLTKLNDVGMQFGVNEISVN